MRNQVATVNDPSIDKVMEKIIAEGDLSCLSEGQRNVYYKKVCDSLKLNPFTRPFEYIRMNGKLILYARKDCTEQLRSIHNISLKITDAKVIDDIYVVIAQASSPDGRIDSSTGAVPVSGLKGDAKANALMKCETKAKRRVTLSFCGLGMNDESEIENIPVARPYIEQVSVISTSETKTEEVDYESWKFMIESALSLEDLKKIWIDLRDSKMKKDSADFRWLKKMIEDAKLQFIKPEVVDAPVSVNEQLPIAT